MDELVIERKMPPSLLKIICCPRDKANLKMNSTKTMLVCIKCKHHYPIREGIPIMTGHE